MQYSNKSKITPGHRAPAARCGFTMIETLVALLLLAVAVPVMLESQMVAIRAERAVQGAEAVCREIDRVLLKSFCCGSVTNRHDEAWFSCEVSRLRNDREFSIDENRNAALNNDITAWNIVPEGSPSFNVVVFTRPFRE